METAKKANRAGTKNKTWCGVPIDLYRRRKAELSHEDFEKWWFKKTGRPLCIRNEKKTERKDWNEKMYHMRWEAIAHRLQTELNEARKTIAQLENRSWIYRLFNLKG